MGKPIKHAVSVVIKNRREETLFALRNKNEKSFPLTWSLPSHFVKEGENFEDTVGRIGINKLGVRLRPVKLLHEGKSERDTYVLFMHDYLAEVIEGEPKITESDPYERLKWELPEKQLSSMKVMGECCSLYKEFLDLKQPKDK